ncbi:MAG: bifunctional 3,4-dihydroxy-2-butanone-4-phosphate synthase/GTP cyclohydrolase II [Acidimicrobiia bacterium]|nr:bifunctional 3,4-dihydroxy-2-butanone-4-phosphate synthase/GTP cyclohydrolase II [Acidimicrobiia bacterium]
MKTATVEEAIATIAAGEFVLVVDDENRENEGDLIIAAEKVSPEKVAFMVRHTSGLICLPTTGERLDELGLPLMVIDNTEQHRTAFTISVDVAGKTTTGISARDRAATILAVVDPETRPQDLTRPGHMFPLRSEDGGVLARPGHTEAAVDLARLAGLYPAGVVCEVVKEDGSMARADYLEALATRYQIPLITIKDLITYRWRNEALVSREVETLLPTDHGDFRAFGYQSLIDGSEHIALVFGDVDGATDVLTRIHSRCLTGDVLGSRRCDCGPQLRASMGRIAEAGAGVLTYNETHEGRGIGLLEKLRAYRLQDEGRDTVDANLELGFPADARHYAVEAQILSDLKVGSVRLMTNNPQKIEAIERLGIEVAGREALVAGVNGDNKAYMTAKVDRLGHLVGHTEIQ